MHLHWYNGDSWVIFLLLLFFLQIVYTANMYVIIMKV